MKMRKEESESFRIGPIEVTRVGKVISMKNVGTDSDNSDLIKGLTKEYQNNRKRMDDLVKEIRELVSQCNPIEILKYAYENFIDSTGGIPSEVQLTSEQVFIGRELEYIQSVLVSSENNYSSLVSEEESRDTFIKISEKINELYMLSQYYFIYRIAELKSNDSLELVSEQEQFLIEAQQTMFVRGDRYTVYEIPHISELLKPHNDEFVKLYGITADDFTNGLSNIMKSLLSYNPIMDKAFGAEFDFISYVMNAYEEYLKFEEEEVEKGNVKSMKEMVEEFRNRNPVRFDLSNVDAYTRFDLQKVTNWPIKLLRDLSFGLNENKDFYNSEYAGYPLIELPVFQKPFININDKFYCFDYYNLFDNIYRVVQKTIKKVDPAYGDTWQSRQMEVTEDMAKSLFEKLLPGCKIYTSNYYPKNKSLKQLNENDLLVIYDDNLIIVEVKAGSYTYRAPILDIESHIKSLKTLVEVATNQAERTLDYLKSSDTVKLYNKDKSEKCEISYGDYSDVTLMSLTLDNFNEFASKIEKLKFLNVNKNAMAISIDDFRVYSEYFDSPIEFLHYLKQRKLSSQDKSLYLNDELDHLGLYIEHNWYHETFDKDMNRIIKPYGYREKLDIYFSSLINNGLETEKPKQYIPAEIKKIINFLDKSNLKNRVKLGMFLLDFSSEGRSNLNDGILSALKRQSEIKRMVQLVLSGETPICIFFHQHGIESMSDIEIKDYTFATMLQMGDQYRIELNLYYDKFNEIENIKFEFYSYKDIPSERISKLKEMASELSELRIIRYKKDNGTNKIGRNEICPCGSGKKYKKCHGKR